MSKIMVPAAKDAVSVRKTSQTTEDRKRQLQEFREDKEHKQKLKDERYAKMKEDRKGKPPRGRGGINLDITQEPS